MLCARVFACDRLPATVPKISVYAEEQHMAAAGAPTPLSRTFLLKRAINHWKENRAVILIRLGMVVLAGSALCRALGIHLLR